MNAAPNSTGQRDGAAGKVTGSPESRRPDAGAGPLSGPVVLYDGLCGLCDRTVQFVLRHDRRGRFRFATLQGPFAARALAGTDLDPGAPHSRSQDPRSQEDPRSIVLLENPGTTEQRVRLRSDAVLAIIEGLGGAWRLAALARLVPRPLRDLVYALVARVRFRLFGRLDACAIPAPAHRARFLP